jgi:hypothetical protein
VEGCGPKPWGSGEPSNLGDHPCTPPHSLRDHDGQRLERTWDIFHGSTAASKEGEGIDVLHLPPFRRYRVSVVWWAEAQVRRLSHPKGWSRKVRDAPDVVLLSSTYEPFYPYFPGSTSFTEDCQANQEGLKTLRYSPGFRRNGVGCKHLKRPPGQEARGRNYPRTWTPREHPNPIHPLTFLPSGMPS